MKLLAWVALLTCAVFIARGDGTAAEPEVQSESVTKSPSVDPAGRKPEDARIKSATLVMTNALEMPDRGLPKDLLRRCRGIAIFPSVFKIGLLIGAAYGDGVALRRDENTGQWSKPAFFKIQSGSLGLQLGAQYADLVLLIMSEQGMQKLLEERFILGADIAVSAGPVGRQAAAETDVGFGSGILSYSRTQGFFAGISLNGASIAPDIAANAAYHGPGITVQDIFYQNEGTLSDPARDLVSLLEATTE